MERTIIGEAVAKGYPSLVAITSHDTKTVVSMTEIQQGNTIYNDNHYAKIKLIIIRVLASARA